MAPILQASLPLRFGPISHPPRPSSHLSDSLRFLSHSPSHSGHRSSLSPRQPPPSLDSSQGLGGMRRLVGLGLRHPGLDVPRLLVVADGGGSGGGLGGGSGGGGGGDDVRGGDDGLSSPFSWYLKALIEFPVLTKSITSALLTLVGDLTCQLLIDRVLKVNWKRTFVFTFLGLVLVGPTLHLWYLNLSKLVTLQGAPGVFLRLLLDQCLFSPIFIGVFLSSLMILEGRPSETVPKLQQEWFSSVVANWQLWVPFQFLNFRFVPQQFQVLAANVIALVWNVILSFKAHKEVVTK